MRTFNSSQHGFTLIELMITVAIIAILAAIAVPQYQNYVIKSQLTRVYSELNSLRTAVEVCHNDGQATTGGCNLDSLQSDMLISDPSPIFSGAGSSISAVIGEDANPRLQGAAVSITRNTSGTWICDFSAVAVNDSFKPKACQ